MKVLFNSINEVLLIIGTYKLCKMHVNKDDNNLLSTFVFHNFKKLNLNLKAFGNNDYGEIILA